MTTFTIYICIFLIIEETKWYKLLTEGLGFGKWGFNVDSHDMARMMINHIDEKRKALGIDKARERVLLDMAARREMDVA